MNWQKKLLTGFIVTLVVNWCLGPYKEPLGVFLMLGFPLLVFIIAPVGLICLIPGSFLKGWILTKYVPQLTRKVGFKTAFISGLWYTFFTVPVVALTFLAVLASFATNFEDSDLLNQLIAISFGIVLPVVCAATIALTDCLCWKERVCSLQGHPRQGALPLP